MKKIFILFLLLLLAGVGRAFAEGNEELILKALEKREISIVSMDSIPGTNLDKLLAVSLEGEWIPLKESLRREDIIDSRGTLCSDLFEVKTAIRYDSKTGFKSRTIIAYQAREGDILYLACGLILLIFFFLLLYSILIMWKNKDFKAREKVIFLLFVASFLVVVIISSLNVYLAILASVASISLLGYMVATLKTYKKR